METVKPSENSVLSPHKQGKVDLTKMVAARLKRPGNKKVGVKQLLGNEPGADRIENLRQENRERSKKERLELAYPLIQKDVVEEECESEEDSADDADYSIEDTEDSLGSSEEDSSDDYTSDESIQNDDEDEDLSEECDLEVSHDSSTERNGMRRSKKA